MNNIKMVYKDWLVVIWPGGYCLFKNYGHPGCRNIIMDRIPFFKLLEAIDNETL